MSSPTRPLPSDFDVTATPHGNGSAVPQSLPQSMWAGAAEPQDWRAMFEALPAAIYVTDAEGRLTYVNPAAATFADQPPRIGEDRWCVSSRLCHADGRPMPHDQSPTALAVREERPVQDAEAIAERPDGSRCWLQVSATPLRDDAGCVRGTITMLIDITERKQAETANARLAAAIESSDDAIATKDLHGVITSWNPGAERIFGYAASEAVGRPVTMLMPPERVDEEPGILERIRNGNRIEHYETVRQRKDGTLIDISLTVSPIKDAHGRIIGASKVARDITRRKQVERALRESEQRFRALTEATSDVIYTMSPDWTVMHRLVGREFIADTTQPDQSWLDRYIPVEDQPRVRTAIEQAVSTRTTFSLEHRVRRADGTIGWTFSRAIPVFDECGGLLHWFGAASDITRSKVSEEELARQKRLYEGVLSTTPDLAYVFDLRHRFIYANEGLLRMWGRRWDEAIGRTCLELGYEPWHAAMHDREIDQVIETRRPIRGLVPFTGTFGRRLYDYIFTPVLDEAGEVCAVAGTTRDVTEIKQAEEALRAGEERLAVELASMRRLHELSVRLSQTDDLVEVMNEVMAAAAELLRAPRCTAQLLDQETGVLRLIAAAGFDDDFKERFDVVTADDFTTCAAALRHRERVIVEDLAASEDFAVLARITVPLGVRSVMSTPLLSSDDALLGVFTTYWDEPHAPDEHQLRLLDLYVQQAARQVERRAAELSLRGSEQQLEARVADLEVLRQLSLRVAATADRTDALNDILDTAIHLVGAAKGNVQLFSPRHETLGIIAQRGFNQEFLETFGVVPIGYSCCGVAMQRLQRVIIENVHDDPQFADLADVYERHGFRSVQSTPLFTSDGRLLGMFSTHFAEAHRPSERDLRVLDHVAQQAGRVIERTQAEQALRDHARILEVLNQVGATLTAELETQKVIQAVTDAATELSRAKFGAFFFNAVDESGEAYLLYTLSGAPREAFDRFGTPRKTPIFAPTFDGRGVVRSDDITQDPRYGHMAPHHGMPQGHLPVRSYLAVPVHSRSGAVLGGLFFGHPDVGVFTEQAERLVSGIATQAAIAIDNARLYESARESEEHFRAMAENIPQLAWMARPDGHLYWFNRRWYEYTGATADDQELTGWQAALHPDHVDAVTATWTAALRAGESWEDTFPLRASDGSFRWFLSRASPIRDESGRVVRWFGTNTDITAQREAEEELRRHRDRLQDMVEERTRAILKAEERVRLSERMASLGTLSAGLGHDMGNLLVPVRVHLETLEAMDLPRSATGEVEGIRSSIEYLRKLASGLRQLAVDPATPTREPTELRHWWSEAAPVLKNTLPAGVRLECRLPDEPLWVTMPRAALTQAVFNLVQNAGDSLRDRGSGAVTIALTADEAHVLLSVADDGPGMGEEARRRCMEPFYTTKTRGLSTGLGLALVYGLVREAAGAVELESTLGQGTTFTLRLPRAATPDDVRSPRGHARVALRDPRLRALVISELHALGYDTSEPSGHDITMIVADQAPERPGPATTLIMMTEPPEAPRHAIALGRRPGVQAIREALRRAAHTRD